MKLKILFMLNITGVCAVQAQQTKPDISELYSISIIQGTDTFNINGAVENKIELQRKPFKFRFELLKEKYIFFIASESSAYYNTKSNRPFPECMMFCGGAVGADVKFNPDKDICIYDFSQGISCWYYDSTTEHRFDSDAVKSENGLFVERSIENFYVYSATKSTKVSKLKPGAVYHIVFMDPANEPCDDCDGHQEVNPWRRKLKLTFK